jgi:acetyltransferase-like isoleucine patch superfamily enzyme
MSTLTNSTAFTAVHMKTEPLDFVLSAILLAAIGAIAGAITASVAVPGLRVLLGEYHVVGDALFLILMFGLVAAAVVHLLLRIWPLPPGEHSMHTLLFTRWKLVVVISEFGRGALKPFTTEFSKPLVARLFGATIGRNTALAGHMTDLPFISVGSGCILGINSVVTGHAITSGKIVLGKVHIDEGATIGVGVVIMPGVEIGARSVVAAGSVVTLGTKIPAGEFWAGTPARRIKEVSVTEIRG